MITSRSIHVAANGIVLLLFMANICVCVCVYTQRIFFMHSCVSGHLGCFRVLAVVNSALWTLGCNVLCFFFYLEFSPFPDIWPGVGLRDHMATLFLVFWGTSILFSKCLYQFAFLPTVYGGFLILYTFSSIYYL